jgi:hypothetical protein
LLHPANNAGFAMTSANSYQKDALRFSLRASF